MVVSSACITTARMTQAVMAGRLIACACGTTARSGMIGSRRSKPSSQEARKAALMAGIDAQLDAHADAQLGFSGDIGDADAHRDPLHDLDPVAAGVFGRQQRKARRGSWADAVDGAGPALARISVNLHCHLLPGLDVG